MKTNNVFSANRLVNLFGADFIKNKWLYLLLFESVTGLLLFLFISFGASKQTPYNYSLLFGWTFFVVGILISGFSFNELTIKTGNYHYLLLPVSNLEKLIQRILILFIVFPVIMIVSLLIVYVLGNFLNDLAFKAAQVPTEMLFSKIMNSMKAYYIISPVFIFGSIYFKELGLIKIVLVGSCIIFFVFMYVMLLYKIFFWNHVDGFGFLLKPGFVFANTGIHKMAALMEDIFDALKFIVMYLLNPAFIILSFIALREKEV